MTCKPPPEFDGNSRANLSDQRPANTASMIQFTRVTTGTAKGVLPMGIPTQPRNNVGHVQSEFAVAAARSPGTSKPCAKTVQELRRVRRRGHFGPGVSDTSERVR